jgi:flagellar protein FlaG
MNVVPNTNELGLAGLSSEYKRTGDTVTQNNTEVQKVGETLIDNTYVDTAQKSPEKSDVHQHLTSQQLDKVAQQLQDFVGDLNRNIEFSVDEDSGKDVIKVIDKDSGDILKQYPSEEVLTLVSKLSEMVGGLVDEKV